MAEIAVRDDINNTKNIISKRLMNLDYYKRLHQGSLFWLNAIRLSHDHIRRHYDKETLALRAKQFFCLGMSIGNILRINDISQAKIYINEIGAVICISITI